MESKDECVWSKWRKKWFSRVTTAERRFRSRWNRGRVKQFGSRKRFCHSFENRWMFLNGGSTCDAASVGAEYHAAPSSCRAYRQTQMSAPVPPSAKQWLTASLSDRNEDILRRTPMVNCQDIIWILHWSQSAVYHCKVIARSPPCIYYEWYTTSLRSLRISLG